MGSETSSQQPKPSMHPFDVHDAEQLHHRELNRLALCLLAADVQLSEEGLRAVQFTDIGNRV